MLKGLLDHFSWQGWILFTAVTFGAFQFVIYFIKWFFNYETPPINKLCAIILVKDAEDYIEGIIRQLASLLALDHRALSSFKLVVVDNGSKDQTPRILSYLSKHYSFLEFIKRDGLDAHSTPPVQEAMSKVKEDLVCVIDVTSQIQPERIIQTLMFLLNKTRDNRKNKFESNTAGQN